MACATLKRGQNFDLLDSCAVKRRRFGDFSNSIPIEVPQSPFVPSQPTTEIQLKRRIKEEIKRLQRRRLIPRFLGTTPVAQTVFGSEIRQDNVAVASCSGSFRSMALRSPSRDSAESDGDQSPPRQTEPNFSSLQSTPSTPSALSTVIPSPRLSPATRNNIDSVAIFTLPQVIALCGRLIKEREDDLRQEYDNILSCKLAEQYEAFLKFNHDQLQSRFQNTPMSYVS